MIPYLPKTVAYKGRTGPDKTIQQPEGRWSIDWHLALKYAAIFFVSVGWLVGHFGGYVQSVGVTICPSTIAEVAL